LDGGGRRGFWEGAAQRVVFEVHSQRLVGVCYRGAFRSEGLRDVDFELAGGLSRVSGLEDI
jgi:hypothetical protein